MTMDEARAFVRALNPGWRDGGESPQVIDNVAEAYRTLCRLDNRPRPAQGLLSFDKGQASRVSKLAGA